MDIFEAMERRHSVRSYTDKPIEAEVLNELKKLVVECNKESGLHLQLITNEPTAFTGIMARYGKFSNVSSYLALVGKNDSRLEELCGYYGEKIALKAQQLGLNSCWVGLSYSKGKAKNAVKIGAGEKLALVLALGHGETNGTAHKSKAATEVSNITPTSPDWFRAGVEAALLAPTALNKQKFFFTLNDDGTVTADSGSGAYTKVDLGIAKYHFEVGAQRSIKWTN